MNTRSLEYKVSLAGLALKQAKAGTLNTLVCEVHYVD